VIITFYYETDRLPNELIGKKIRWPADNGYTVGLVEHAVADGSHGQHTLIVANVDRAIDILP
jgi:hypothetical protein